MYWDKDDKKKKSFCFSYNMGISVAMEWGDPIGFAVFISKEGLK